MITGQTMKKQWTDTTLFSMVLALLIFFFLSGAAECSTLEIQEKYCDCDKVEIGGEIYFTVRIEKAGRDVREFGFTVAYDEDILEYKRYSRDAIVEYFDILVTRRNNLVLPGDGFGSHSELNVHGIGFDSQNVTGVIERNTSDDLMDLVFVLKRCEKTTIEIGNLTYDFSGWNHLDGDLRIIEGGGSSSSWPSYLGYPRFVPGGLGYTSFALPQLYSNRYPYIPINYAYFGLSQFFPYQGLPYSSWQPNSFLQPNLYQQPSYYSQSLWPYWGGTQSYYNSLIGGAN